MKKLYALLSIVIIAIGCVLLIGELQQFEPLLFITIKVLGFGTLALGIFTFPYDINTTLKQDDVLERFVTIFCTFVIISFIVYYFWE